VIKQEIPFSSVSWLQRSTSTKNYERSIFACLLLWYFLLLVISYYKQRRVFHTKTSSSSSSLGMVFKYSLKNWGNELNRLGVNNQASSEIADWDKIGKPCKSTTLHVTVERKCSIQFGGWRKKVVFYRKSYCKQNVSPSIDKSQGKNDLSILIVFYRNECRCPFR